MEEIWKSIKDYEVIYEVSNFGRVKSLERLVSNGSKSFRVVKERILKACNGNNKYLIVILCNEYGYRKTHYVHHLVASEFLNHKSSGYELVINHKDFNTLNNSVNNLEIISNRKNTDLKHLKENYSSRYTGVCWKKRERRWYAYITIDGKNKHLGRFTVEYDAHLAYEKALKDLLRKS